MTDRVLRQRAWMNGGLLALVAGLAALAWLEPGREPPVVSPPLLPLTAAQIERIVIERPGQASLAFVRDAAIWRMQAPLQGVANPILMNALLQLPEARCAPQYPIADLDLASVQLQPPRLRLWLNGQELAFGDLAPVSALRYVRIGARVALCPDDWMKLLTSAAGSFLTAPVRPEERR